jgi:hypothetical protein
MLSSIFLIVFVTVHNLAIMHSLFYHQSQKMLRKVRLHRLELTRVDLEWLTGLESSRVERLPESPYRVVTRLLESWQH